MYIKNFKVFYTNNLFSQKNYITPLIIYAPKTLPICHHVFNKSEKGDKANFEINSVIMRKSQIRVCTPFFSNKYILYIGVD